MLSSRTVIQVDKETFIKTYTDIETKTFIRKDKHKKLDELLQFSKVSGTNFTADEIIEITNELLKNGAIIRQPLFQTLLYPCLSEQVEKGNIEAIKLLIRLDQHLISYQGYTKDYKYTSVSLLKKGLEIAPNDRELLEMYESNTREYINHTLHELPSGVLYDMDGASIVQCDELLALTDEYESICKKLQIDRSELINECRFYYSTYKSYLTVCKNYKNFDGYLSTCEK